MKHESHSLILSPLGTLKLEQTTTDDGKTVTDLVWQLQMGSANHWATFRGLESNQTPTDLDRLAEQMELASVQLRSIIADMDPGRRFESIQAEQFQAGRLEGDL